MSAVLETHGLTKRFGRFAALRDCDLELPARKVIGLVGPNGAGKTTLLQLAVGLRTPTSGTISVLDHSPTHDAVSVLARVGFVAQDRPLYEDFTVAETLQLAKRLNRSWDTEYALARLRRFRIALDRRVRTLSTGQRAQVALTAALGKRPELLLLDEPVANLDPLARLEVLEELMGTVADDSPTVVMSSNALADIERVCEYLVILVDGRVRLAGDIDELVRTHLFIAGPRVPDAERPDEEVVDVRHADRQSIRVVRRRSDRPAPPAPDGTVTRPATLEEVVLAYLRTASVEAER